MKQCPECSAQNSADSKFCKSCGANIENVANFSKDLSAAASSILNQAGNFLIIKAKKNEQPPREETSSSEAETEEKASFKLIHSKHRKWLVLAASITVVFIIMLSLGALNSGKLIGMWKMYPNEMPGYGICLEIDKDTIEATGDYEKFGGRMVFKYKVIDDSSLTLQYDWTFDQWPWSFPHVNRIPLKYSVNEDGTTLTLIWDGTNFVFLDNTHNMDYFNQNGVIMNGGSVTFTKVK